MTGGVRVTGHTGRTGSTGRSSGAGRTGGARGGASLVVERSQAELAGESLGGAFNRAFALAVVEEGLRVVLKGALEVTTAGDKADEAWTTLISLQRVEYIVVALFHSLLERERLVLHRGVHDRSLDDGVVDRNGRL